MEVPNMFVIYLSKTILEGAIIRDVRILMLTIEVMGTS